MKICIVEQCTDVVGGVERVVSTLANNFIKNDDVTVVNEFRTYKKSFYKYDDRVKFINLCDNSFLKGENYFINFIRRARRKVLMNLTYKKVLKVFQESDVIIFGRVIVAKRFYKYFKKNDIKAKVICRDAANFKYLTEDDQRFVLNDLPKFVNYFLTLSNENRDYYIKMGFDTKRTNIMRMINPLGIEPEMCYNPDAKTVFSFGRLCFQKNFENLILAFKYVHEKHPDWSLKIYGNGESKNKLVNLIKENNLTDCAYIMSSNNNIKDFFKTSSIYVMPSRFEGYGNTLAESLSCGMPSISYDWVMGVSDFVDDGKNGMIVKLKNRDDYFKGIDSEEDVKNLADAINKLIEDPKLCDKFSKEAFKTGADKDVKTIIKKWYEIIKK